VAGASVLTDPDGRLPIMRDPRDKIQVRCVSCWTDYETTVHAFRERLNRCPKKDCQDYKAQDRSPE
jgi:hypothetical protein